LTGGLTHNIRKLSAKSTLSWCFLVEPGNLEDLKAGTTTWRNGVSGDRCSHWHWVLFDLYTTRCPRLPLHESAHNRDTMILEPFEVFEGNTIGWA